MYLADEFKYTFSLEEIGLNNAIQRSVSYGIVTICDLFRNLFQRRGWRRLTNRNSIILN